MREREREKEKERERGDQNQLVCLPTYRVLISTVHVLLKLF